MVIGFAVSLLAILWAFKNGQFTDQQRARYLPLENEPEQPHPKVTRFNRYETYGLLFLICAGLMSSAAVLVFALFFGG